MTYSEAIIQEHMGKKARRKASTTGGGDRSGGSGAASRRARGLRRINEPRRSTRLTIGVLLILGAAAAFLAGRLLRDLSRPDSGDVTAATTPMGPRDGSPSWSPFGERIVFYSERDGRGQIHMMHLDGSDRRRLTSGSGDEGYPSWSPDGSTILYDSDETGDFEIWAVDSLGSNPRNLTNNPARDVAGAWSPDGNRIAFMSDRDGGAHALYVMDADGSNVRKIDTPGSAWFPQWSPDGTKIALHVERDVHVVNADGSIMQRLTQDPANGMYPTWSPDGMRIAFMSWRNGSTELFIMNADGSDQRKLFGMAGGDVVDPRWSPDGRYILFGFVPGGMSGSAQSIWMIGSDGSEPRQLTGRRG